MPKNEHSKCSKRRRKKSAENFNISKIGNGAIGCFSSAMLRKSSKIGFSINSDNSFSSSRWWQPSRVCTTNTNSLPKCLSNSPKRLLVNP